MKIMKIIINTVVCLFILAVLALPFLGIHSYIVRSGSMEPTIATGSLVLVNEKIDYAQLETGDIIVFDSEGTKVTHRVLAIHEDGIETKGDNNNDTDGITTTRANFTGKVIYWIPNVGFMIDGNKKYVALAMVLFIYVLSILFCNVFEKKVPKVKETSSRDLDL